jgi:hypothetical protein
LLCKTANININIFFGMLLKMDGLSAYFWTLVLAVVLYKVVSRFVEIYFKCSTSILEIIIQLILYVDGCVDVASYKKTTKI